jgi:hypothetical protein
MVYMLMGLERAAGIWYKYGLHGAGAGAHGGDMVQIRSTYCWNGGGRRGYGTNLVYILLKLGKVLKRMDRDRKTGWSYR